MQVVERRPLAAQLGRVGERSAAVRRLAVERRGLVRVLAVAQVGDLLEDEGEARRKHVPRDLVEVGGDLGVVGGDRAERLGREERPELRRHEAVLAQLGDEAGVVVGARDRGDAGGVPGGCAEEGCSTHVDHLDRLVDADEPGTDRRGERRDVDDDDVDQPDRVRLELAQLFGDVATGEDPGVDRGVERLDLAADERRRRSSAPKRSRPRRHRRRDARGCRRWRRFPRRARAGHGRDPRSRRGWRPTAGLAPGPDLPSPRSHALDVCGRV